MTVRFDSPQVGRITYRSDERLGTWGVLMWTPDGVVTLHTDHGSWVHQWHPSHIGPESIPAFLGGLNREYAARKFMGSDASKLDVDATVRACRELVLDGRRREELGRVDARDSWDCLAYATDEHEIADAMGHMWAGDVPWKNRLDPSFANMWERIWVPGFQAALRDLGTPATQRTAGTS